MQAANTTPHEVVFLFDCDNTLLDNDHVLVDLRAHMMRQFGEQNSTRYWQIFEDLRAELGYADYLGALQRYRQEHPRDTGLLLMSSFLIEYPFANRLYPGALDAIRHVSQRGPAVILSDGDVVFQPRKIARSGLWDEVEGRVLIYIHKELMLDQVMECYPARHYVMVDDKLRILTAMKKSWGERLTTVFPRQGHYAFDPKEIASNPPADVTVERIGELAEIDLDGLLSGGTVGGA
ncbi:HAD family hydrolase [Paraburkholderia caffeinilytica]|uniref:HAD family hydrolase n=1 Tax=Paraburkholderia caffeinilytica TaxID=1761016 RepID=UPI003DA09E1A